MSDNIYNAPKSKLDGKVDDDSLRKIYSPTQVACGTIGGPVGLVYFLMANFETLEDEGRKKKTLILGIVLIVALIAILPFLPENIPSAPFTVAYIVIARQVATNYQMKKQEIIDSEAYDFHSNWRVLGLGLLCLVGSVLVIVGPLMILALTGVWNVF